MAQKCVHKGCGKVFSDPDEDCIHHPGPPIFHEGQKGWKCCKPRVLTFDEFLSIPPCTTGKHSIVEEAPQPWSKPRAADDTDALTKELPTRNLEQTSQPAVMRIGQPIDGRSAADASSPAPPPESDTDDPDILISTGATCRRRGCDAKYAGSDANRSEETCVYHPGHPIFHEGVKGYTCCKKRVLEFDEFLRMKGCQTKKKHMFVGSGNKKGGKGASGGANAGSGSGDGDEEILESVRNDFYQTSTTVIASFYLKKINKDKSTVKFSSSTTIDLDLHTSDKKSYSTQISLYGPIDLEKSEFKIMGTKLELTLAKADGTGWPVLKSDDPLTGQIIQSGRAGTV